jgi:hypothetical protein
MFLLPKGLCYLYQQKQENEIFFKKRKKKRRRINTKYLKILSAVFSNIMGSKSGKYTVENGNSVQSRNKILSSFSSNVNESIPSEKLSKEDASLPIIVHQNFLTDTLLSNVNNLTLVWLDTEVYDQPMNIDTQIKLKNLINYLRIFDQIDTCEQYISKMNNDKLLIIVSTTLALTFIPHSHDCPQIKSIYIYGKSKIDTNVSERLLTKYAKVYVI